MRQLDEVEVEGVVTGSLRCRIASGLARGVVTVKAFAVSEVRGIVLVTVIFVVTGSRHLPNQPHFIQVVVVAVIVSVVIGAVVVVLSSYLTVSYSERIQGPLLRLPGTPTSPEYGKLSFVSDSCLMTCCCYLMKNHRSDCF